MAADNERLCREMAETRKQQNRTGELKPASTADQKKQDAKVTRESWGKLKAEAEGRRQISYSVLQNRLHLFAHKDSVNPCWTRSTAKDKE